MQWDLGLRGVGLLVVMSLAFGLLAQFAAGRRSGLRWGAIAAGTYFVAGLFVSEIWFGWATEEELQPNVDGLSFDEVLLLATLLSAAGLFLARRIWRGHHPQPPAPRARHGLAGRH